MINIELLAPAKNLEYGIAAIDCGADAVYIGAGMFGARYAAGNSIEDIAQLCSYAHQFGARVYVTMNTILFENELSSAKSLAMSLCEVGVDALIVQDMAYLEFGLPIELHASTQTAANTLQRVKFLESVGFNRVVLERSLSLEQIATISQASNIEVEAFVHGAICVSNSGECYMGHILSGRSGNRGVCSQPCRATYTLSDESGRILERDKHLLSVKDMMLSSHIGKMIDSGVRSFKIEGRLKDITYLKSSVLHYRIEIDKQLSKRQGFVRSSVGVSSFDAEVDPNRSFTRGFSDYFLMDNRQSVSSFATAKAVGQYVGRVGSCGRDFFSLESRNSLNNGDGICFISKKGEFLGTNINISDQNKIYPNRMDGISQGVEIYRNFDIKYNAKIASLRPQRQIDLQLELTFLDGELEIVAQDISLVSCNLRVDSSNYQEAQNLEKATQTLINQLKKSGGTIFRVVDVTINGTIPFIPIGEINAIRRKIFEQLQNKRVSSHPKPIPTTRLREECACGALSYTANVSNSLSRKFYSECGYTHIEDAIELRNGSYEGVEAMKMRYCLRRERGECILEGGDTSRWYLHNGQHRFELVCDCANCITKLIYIGKI